MPILVLFDPSTDPRAPAKPSPSTQRVAAAWTTTEAQNSSFTIGLNFTGTRRVAIYCVDWLNTGTVLERIEVFESTDTLFANPSTVMGAASVGLPTIVVPGGPMLNGKYKGGDIGSGTHVWKFDEDMKTGKMTQEECTIAESCMSRSVGHCMTMGRRFSLPSTLT